MRTPSYHRISFLCIDPDLFATIYLLKKPDVILNLVLDEGDELMALNLALIDFTGIIRNAVNGNVAGGMGKVNSVFHISFSLSF